MPIDSAGSFTLLSVVRAGLPATCVVDRRGRRARAVARAGRSHLVAATAGACVGFVAVRVASARPRWRTPLLGTLISVVIVVLGVLV